MRKCLITRNIRIDLFGPRIDAAGHIRDFRKSAERRNSAARPLRTPLGKTRRVSVRERPT